MSERARKVSIWDAGIVRQAVVDSVWKLDPRIQFKNPVMFIVEAGSVLTTIVFVEELVAGSGQPLFTGQVAFWLWFTVLFANFAEAMAEGRGKAQAETLRRAKTETVANRLGPGDRTEQVPAASLRKGDVVMVRAGEFIPADGEIIEGVATVDESAITGESAPVVRESGGDRSAVTGGTRVISDWIKVRVTAEPGHSFLDRMIALVEGAERQKTPNEIALNILLAVLTLVFLLVVVTLQPFAHYAGTSIPIPVLIALLVCLIPTTIGALISAIGIAGMDRLVQHNVLAMSGRAVEAAGDVHTLLLDKTGTITLGNRQATEFLPLPGISDAQLADAAQLSSLADETPEGRSIVVLAKERFGLRGRDLGENPHTLVPFTAQTRMSGIDLDGRRIRKGAAEAIERYLAANGGSPRPELRAMVEQVARKGGTPLVVAEGNVALGVIHLKDIVKGGMRERFVHLRAMGIRTVMITGDNPLTAASIANEAGVDDFLAEATPEDKMALIRREQAEGKLVAMTGDGTNDAPALAQADVGVAMNTGTTAAKEAGNMVDLDSNPTKLIEIVEIGKQLLMTRGALTTFSIANDVAKYFAIIPAMFILAFPQLGRPEHHAAGDTGIGDSVGGHLQCRHHHRVDPAGVEGHCVHTARRGGSAAAKPAHLRCRRRRAAIHRHQAHRRGAGVHGTGIASGTMDPRPTADALLERLKQEDRARLRIYIGAAPGVGKTYEMLQEAHALRKRGLDVVVGVVETYGRRDTVAQLKDLELIPRRRIAYRGVTMEEMDVDAIVARRPQVCLVDELAHTNAPGSRHPKRYEDVLEILDAGIHVMTAVNIQHLETLNDAVARATGVRVRETVPDTFLDRADEVINVDVTVEELRSRLREGKIYGPEKIEQALTNFFRKGNLSTLRELALRAVADEVSEKAASYRLREGLEPALIPERVMVCMSSNSLAPRVIRTGARIAGRLGARWYAVYVETPREKPGRIRSNDADALHENIRLAESLGATVVRVRADSPSEGLIAFAQREGVTHVIFGQSARTRWELLWRGSTLDRFLGAVPDAAVQVVPLTEG